MLTCSGVEASLPQLSLVFLVRPLPNSDGARNSASVDGFDDKSRERDAVEKIIKDVGGLWHG
ncbi:hypothetical protein [Roseiconus lacunae]|uniref:hypothetical protein n=1 Tax=Roseiconus lacunae TaxID=2605694 RepID=UPI001E572A73|nr:hypothetical protein [Roseiconus lacunae]